MADFLTLGDGPVIAELSLLGIVGFGVGNGLGRIDFAG